MNEAIVLLLLIGYVLWKIWVIRTILEKDVSFHYVANSSLPDVIQVWYKSHHIYSYTWINGEQAFPGSRLGRIHARYRAKERKEISDLIS